MIRINGRAYDSTANDNSKPGRPYGTYHLADNPDLYEIQRTNNFEFLVTEIDDIRRAGLADTDTNPSAIIKNAQEVIRLSVVSADIPHFSQRAIEVKRGNTTLKYAGVPEFSDGKITVNDYIGANTLEVLQAWQNLSYNVRTEKVGLAGDYKKDCYLVEYSPDYQEVRRFKLHGCWISSLSEDTLTNENNSKHTIQATITFDRAEIDNTGF